MDFFAYEVWMLQSTADRIFCGPVDLPTRNALLESFLIHARALIDFFSGKGAQSDDIVVGSYVQGQDWAITELLSGERTRINKQVAHLTTARDTVASDRKRHDVIAIRNDILALVAKFLKAVDPVLLGERFDKLEPIEADPPIQVSRAFIQVNCTTGMD
jgi:hypothetical protein